MRRYVMLPPRKRKPKIDVRILTLLEREHTFKTLRDYYINAAKRAAAKE